jgi:hypothetical protein
MRCGSASGNRVLQLTAIGTVKKRYTHNCSRILKQTTFLEHKHIGRFFKISSTGILFQKLGLSSKRITIESSLVVRRCSLSSKVEHTDF